MPNFSLFSVPFQSLMNQAPRILSGGPQGQAIRQLMQQAGRTSDRARQLIERGINLPIRQAPPAPQAASRVIPKPFVESVGRIGQQGPRAATDPAVRSLMQRASDTSNRATQLIQRGSNLPIQQAPSNSLGPAGGIFNLPAASVRGAGAGLSAATAQPQKNQFESALNLVAPFLPFGIGIGATAAQVLEGVPTGTFTSARGEGYGTPPGTKKGSLRNFGPGYKEKELRAGGSLRNYGPGYKEGELEAGRQAEQFRAGAGFPGQQRTGGAQPPGTGLGNAAVVPTYDMTPQGQFQRYFTDNQMGQYFGGAPSAQAPKSATAMEEAAMLQKAPTTMPLADYYRSQSATGRANMDQIIGLMGYTGDMEKWARANPMLAQRAFAAQFQGGGPATQGAPGAQPVLDEALNPSSPEFRGVGGTGDRIHIWR